MKLADSYQLTEKKQISWFAQGKFWIFDIETIASRWYKFYVDYYNKNNWHNWISIQLKKYQIKTPSADMNAGRKFKSNKPMKYGIFQAVD